jgi:hypothetical protein
MSPPLPLLLAAGLNEIVSVLVGLAFFVIWVINQINDAKKKQVADEQRKAAQAQLSPEPAAAAGNAPPADPLRSQVDEFLRRAGKQPAPAPQGPPRPPRMPTGREEVVVLLDDPSVPPRVSPPRATPPRVAPKHQTLAETMRKKTDAADIERAKPTASQRPRENKSRPQQPAKPPRSKSVAEPTGASRHDFNKEVADLGARVKQADAQFDRQIQQKFDHTVGSLTTRPTGTVQPAADAPLPAAAQIAAMLASPDGVRQAVILNEILNRPLDRW